MQATPKLNEGTNGGVVFATNTFLRPSNYTRNWRLRLDKSFTGKWNPLEDTNAEITGGKEVQVTCAANSVIGENTMTISSIDNLLSGSNIHPERLTTGMVLKSFKNNSGSKTDINKPLILSEIEEISLGIGLGSVYQLKFKTYDGADDLATANLLDQQSITPHSNCKLYFYQFPMNGLSPNSAKNLNYFRNGTGWDAAVGTDALGYTIQFVEKKSSESEEDLLPSNPAVWETVPKENKDLDIYYEASDTMPIQLELTDKNISDWIPVGSKVEHVGSNVMPENTTVYSIDPINGNIVLTNNIEVEKLTHWTEVNHQTQANQTLGEQTPGGTPGQIGGINP